MRKGERKRGQEEIEEERQSDTEGNENERRWRKCVKKTNKNIVMRTSRGTFEKESKRAKREG